MKNYILMLGVAGVAIGSYYAYAGNSATMQVTATIAHDVSLTTAGVINLGTITINPAYTEGHPSWYYDKSGVVSYNIGNGVVSANNATTSTFTANVPNPSECNDWIYGDEPCSGLKMENNGYIDNMFGDEESSCGFGFYYTGSNNRFNIYPRDCFIDDVSQVATGNHSGNLTISYTPQ